MKKRGFGFLSWCSVALVWEGGQFLRVARCCEWVDRDSRRPKHDRMPSARPSLRPQAPLASSSARNPCPQPRKLDPHTSPPGTAVGFFFCFFIAPPSTALSSHRGPLTLTPLRFTEIIPRRGWRLPANACYAPARGSICDTNCPSYGDPRCHWSTLLRCCTACSAASSKRSLAYVCGGTTPKESPTPASCMALELVHEFTTLPRLFLYLAQVPRTELPYNTRCTPERRREIPNPTSALMTRGSDSLQSWVRVRTTCTAAIVPTAPDRQRSFISIDIIYEVYWPTLSFEP